MATNLKKLFRLLLLVAALNTLQGCGLLADNLTNSETIEITKSLAEKLNVNHPDNLMVKSNPIILTLFAGDNYKNTKLVRFPDNIEVFAVVSCKNKAVTNLRNFEAMKRVLDNLGPEYQKTWPPFWKKDTSGLFIDGNKASSILLELSKRIGLPGDVEQPVIKLNKDYGTWTAKWQRKFNGHLFDKDAIVISINAVSGEFQEYWKAYNGEPCSTEIKVDKNTAIDTAFKKFIDEFPDDNWEKNKDKFEIVSVELRIVKPDKFWQRLFPFYNSKSRLAWIIEFNTKLGQERNTIGVLNKDKSVIWVDAASNKILTSEINIVM